MHPLRSASIMVGPVWSKQNSPASNLRAPPTITGRPLTESTAETQHLGFCHERAHGVRDKS
jgi:hypothetical protein